MTQSKIVIIGAGLSGLYAAYLLELQGIKDYLVVEARDRLGGRVHSIVIDEAKSKNEAFDMGATWFWEKQQPELTHLINKFGLESFYQYEEGDLLIDRTSSREALRMQGVQTSPARRLQGGMYKLIEKIASYIPSEKILLGHQVKSLSRSNDEIDVELINQMDQSLILKSSRILLAVPPRISLNTISFHPSLPEQLTQHWQQTNTWMAAHAKYFAVYTKAFWRDQNLSGAVHGTVTPLFEIHDASSTDGYAALFGFIAAPLSARNQLSCELLCLLCRKQLVRLFGKEANFPIKEFIHDWTLDPLTATSADEVASLISNGIPDSTPPYGDWQNSIVAISSEFSPNHQGYLAGAIESATLGIQIAIERL